jgi:hypothetical protein
MGERQLRFELWKCFPSNLSRTIALLQIDLTQPDPELRLNIKAQCSDFGFVKSVKIHHDPNPVALVEMATYDQTVELAEEYGGSVSGAAALIHLEQEN